MRDCQSPSQDSIARAKHEQLRERLEAGCDPVTGRPILGTLVCARCDRTLRTGPSALSTVYAVCSRCASHASRLSRPVRSRPAIRHAGRRSPALRAVAGVAH